MLVVLRSDGTSLYATKDLELARRKFNDWHVDRSIYVIDSRQSLYFQQVFRVLELWGFKQADKAFQLAYEFVNTPEGAISSRRGGAPQYETLESEALRARPRGRGRQRRRAAAQPHRRAKGRNSERGGLRRAQDGDARQGQQQGYHLRVGAGAQPREPVGHLRAVFARPRHPRARKGPPSFLPRPGEHYDFKNPELQETNLLELIARLPEEVARAAEAYKPVIIATYCFEMADAFNNFYHNCPILKAGSDEKIRARLALTAAAKQTISNALGLLGIKAPDMM